MILKVFSQWQLSATIDKLYLRDSFFCFHQQNSFLYYDKKQRLKAQFQVWNKFLAIWPKNLFLFWRYLTFCSDFFGHAGRQLDNKAKVNLWGQKWENKYLQYTQCPISQEVIAGILAWENLHFDIQTWNFQGITPMLLETHLEPKPKNLNNGSPLSH